MNSRKLLGKMVERGFTADTLADALGIHRATVYRKIKALDSFTVGEAKQIKDVLAMTNEEAVAIFFG